MGEISIGSIGFENAICSKAGRHKFFQLFQRRLLDAMFGDFYGAVGSFLYNVLIYCPFLSFFLGELWILNSAPFVVQDLTMVLGLVFHSL